jgi:N-sulfoglucosamine sulfohydrolase
MPFRRFSSALVLMLLAAASLAAEPSKRPNILFAIADDWGLHAGAFGTEWVKTPAFDRVAREGVLFKNAFTNNPKCSPCRASLLTGRNSWQNEAAMVHFSLMPRKWPVYPDLLEAAGYHVGLTGKGWGPGDWKSTGWTRNPAGPGYDKRKLDPPTNAMSRNDYAANFADFLAARQPGQPFCFWYGAVEPHRDYEEGSGVRAGKKPADVRLPAFYPDQRAIRSDYLDYALEVEWFDSHLGKMLAALEAAGELENTIVVVTSDHGEPFPRVKGQIYDRGFHIPLAVRWGAKAPRGRVVEDFINVRDFAPTFLELCGAPIPESMTGRSFAAALLAEKSGWIDETRNRMVIGKERHDLGRPGDAGYPVRAIRTPEWLYVRNYEPERWPAGNPETGYRNVDGGATKSFLLERFDRFYRLNFGKRPAEELYHVGYDPDCVENLAAKPEHAELMAKLRAEMEDSLRRDGDPRMAGEGAKFDAYPYVGPRTHAHDTWLQNQ